MPARELSSKDCPSLYGIISSNRNFADPYYWGKNQFNSSFPVALACYMRDRKQEGICLRLNSKGGVERGAIGFGDLFGTSQPNSKIHFSFETGFKPYEDLVADNLVPIDLVVMTEDRTPIRPVEIKLTTLPDDSTSELTEDRFGTEIVVRSPTLKYMALGIANSLGAEGLRDSIRKRFEPLLRVRNWDNATEARKVLPDASGILEDILRTFQNVQQPMLMQPIWKTVGKSASLADQCLDIFVWSDFALTRLFMGEADAETERISRPQRATLRLARFLAEWSRGSKVFQAPIFDGMTYDTLNDKEFSAGGRKTNPMMACARLQRPAIGKHEIKRIILGGGQKHLSPERRFDAIIYFSTDLFDSP